MSRLDRKTAAALEGAPRLVVSTVMLMEELIRVLTAETDVVTKRKMAEHAALLKQKQRLTIDYRANMKSIAAQPELLKKLPDEAKEVLKDVAKHLAEAIDSNARMLRAAVDATRQLIQNIMTMIRSEAMPQGSYRNPSKAHLAPKNLNSVCRPIAVHRTV